MRDRRRIITGAAAFMMLLVTVLCIPLRAAASNINYSGELDPQTNEPVHQGNTENGPASGRVQLSSTMSYDWKTHDFVFSVGNTLNEIHCSAADGMIVDKPVTLSTGADASIVVFRNGSEYTGSLSTIKEVGDYVVSSQQAGDKVRVMAFTIVGKTTNAVTVFSAPDGFYLTSATRDGEEIYYDRYNTRMEQEGLYHIEYECVATDVVYTLDTSIDRTPPSLTFEGRINEEWQVRSALKFSGYEKDGSIVLTRSGVQVQPELNSDGTGTIYDSGIYVMKVFDAAGNMSEYRFSILTYFTVGSLIFIALAVAIIISVIVYILIKRKNLRIG